MRDIDKIKGSKVAVHCTTQKECLAIIDMMCHSEHNNDYLLAIDKANYNICFSALTCNSYAEVSWYTENGYTIIPASEFLATDKPKLNLRDKKNDWCVKNCVEVLPYLNAKRKCVLEYTGKASYYGFRNAYTFCDDTPWGTEYTIHEFLTALSEYNATKTKLSDLLGTIPEAPIDEKYTEKEMEFIDKAAIEIYAVWSCSPSTAFESALQLHEERKKIFSEK